MTFTYTIILNESISESFTYTVDENGKVKTTGDGAGSFSTITQTDDNGGTVNVPVIVFANGRATVQMKDGGELTINDLPLGITYTVIETANTDFAAEDGLERTGIIQASQSATGLATASYKNIRNTGKLVISKTLSTVRTNDDDLTNKAFTFTVEFGKALKAGTYNAVITRTDTGTKVRDENITLNDSSNTMNGISLKHGETITIEGLPVGLAYEVTEEPQAGYLPTPASGKVSGVITPVTSNGAATAIASFLNTKQEGGLIVSKTMISDVTADNDEFFDFTVTLTGAKLSGLYGEMVFTTSDNVSDNTSTATFKLKHGEKKSATGLPAGLTYKVAEQLTNAQSSVFELLRYEGETDGKISTTSAANVGAVNRRKTGELEISKTVVSDVPADQNQDFTFNVILENGKQKLTDVYSGIAFNEGKGKIYLHGGESFTLTGVPVGTTWSVLEEPNELFVQALDSGSNGGEISTEKSMSAWKNTRKTGDLEITKTVESPVEADKTTPYTFRIYLDAPIGTDTEKEEYDVYNGNTKVGKVSFANGIAEITLTPGDTGSVSRVIKGLPGTTTGTALPAGNGASGKIAIDDTQKVSIKNTRDKGSLEIRKKLFIDDTDQTNNEIYKEKIFYVKVR